MLVILLLQAATLLPPTAPTQSGAPPIQDPVYRLQLEKLLLRPSAEWVELRAFRPSAPEQTQVLIDWLEKGDQRQARLAAVLSAGATSPPLLDALFRAAFQRKHEATSLACLLAPTAMPSSYCGSMAYLAQSPTAAISVRAAAAGRLIEEGYLGVWPLCRSIFRSGTAGDERPIWADWKRGKRWELPKRLLLISLNRLLEKNNKPPSSFEPNSAWDKQLEQIQETEAFVGQLALPDASIDANRSAAIHRLFDQILKGDRCAELAFPWLAPFNTKILRLNLASTNAKRREVARRLLESAPR